MDWHLQSWCPAGGARSTINPSSGDGFTTVPSFSYCPLNFLFRKLMVKQPPKSVASNRWTGKPQLLLVFCFSLWRYNYEHRSTHTQGFNENSLPRQWSDMAYLALSERLNFYICSNNWLQNYTWRIPIQKSTCDIKHGYLQLLRSKASKSYCSGSEQSWQYHIINTLFLSVCTCY